MPKMQELENIVDGKYIESKKLLHSFLGSLEQFFWNIFMPSKANVVILHTSGYLISQPLGRVTLFENQKLKNMEITQELEINQIKFVDSSSANVDIFPELKILEGEKWGEIIMSISPKSDAKTYLWQYGETALPHNDDDWINLGYSTKPIFVFNKMSNVATCWFRVVVFSGSGIEQWGKPKNKLFITSV